MRITIFTKKFGSQSINTDTFNPRLVSSSSTIFKAMEHIFWSWYNHRTQPGAPLSKDIVGCYEGYGDGEPAIYSFRGAIVEAIELFIEQALEQKKAIYTSRDLVSMDLECAFEI